MARFAAVLLLLLAGAVPALAEPTEIIQPDAITSGMRGYGLTVFRGDTPVRFEVEALGVLHNAFPGRDLIVFRGFGDVLERSGIIAGMSGSPVYFDGKWAGAVAYSFNFSKEPIGLITPAAAMLGTLNETRPVTGGRRLAAHAAAADQSPALAPIGAPLFIGGLAPRTFAQASELLRGYGLLPVQGGASAAGLADLGPEAIVPGAAFGVQLARGDIDFTGIGTVTWREGDRMLGFGHPMFQFLEGEYPLVTAHIITVNPGYANSFKLGTAGREVGTISIDRAPAVGGVVGPQRARMVPVAVEVLLNGVRRELNFEVVDHPLVFFPIAAMAVSSGIEELTGSGYAVCRYTARFKFRGYPEIVRRDTLYSPQMPEIYDALFPLSLQENPWETVQVERASIEVEVLPGRVYADLEGVRTDHLEVKPGEEVTVLAELRPFNAPRRTVPLKFTVPEWLDDDTRLEVHIGPGNEVLTVPPFNELGPVLKFWEEIGQGDQLMLSMQLPRRTQYIGGRAYPDLPPAVSGVLNAASRTTVASERQSELLQWRVPAGIVVNGGQELTFTVKRRP